MTRLIRSRLRGVPVLGYILSLGNNLLHLPSRNNEIWQQIARTHKVSQKATTEVSELRQVVNDANNSVARIDNSLGTLDDRLAELGHKITVLQTAKSPSAKADASAQGPKTLADNHLLDRFYVEFENRFRGTEEDIYNKQKVYVSYLKPFKDDSRQHPVLDIGCGRGEFLKLLKDEGIHGEGVDPNSTMAKIVRAKGFTIHEQDALGFLLKQKSRSFSAITGFHLVEHIPFDALLPIFEECHRVLVPGGIVIFETPNPENVLVGAFTFYYDPSHLHPLPPDMLAFAISTCGFEKTEILRLHPLEGEAVKTPNKAQQQIQKYFYGPRDYSVIAKKIA